MGLGGGDQLARGATKATFTTPNVTDEQWKEMFGENSGFEERMRKKALAEGLTESQYEEQKVAAAKLAAAQIEEARQKQKQEQELAQANIKIRAIQDRIIVRRIEAAKKASDLFLPDESVEKPYEGIVVAVGPGKFINGDLQRPTVSVGETVVFGKFSGAEVKVGFETFLVLREEDLFLVKEIVQQTGETQ